MNTLPSIHSLANLELNHTDKQNPSHTFAGQNYLHYYERHFESRRAQNLKILEIGVNSGHSLRLWRDYFPGSDIHGLDINPNICRELGDRITVHIGDQSDVELLKKLSREYGPFDLVLDDGSHVNEHILTSFRTLFPLMPPESLYAIEDTRCTYVGVDSGWIGMCYNMPNTQWQNNRTTFNEFWFQQIRDLDHFQGLLRSLHFYSMVMLAEKL